METGERTMEASGKGPGTGTTEERMKHGKAMEIKMFSDYEANED